MPKTATLAPLDDSRFWRSLLARVHPDSGGSHELFLFASALKEEIESGGSPRCERCQDQTGVRTGTSTGDRIDFNPPSGDPFEHLRMILVVAKDVPSPFRDVLLLLIDCPTEDHGRAFAAQAAGATYRQLAYLAHLAGFSDEERRLWYSLAQDLSLSARHISHIINELKRQAAA